MVEDAEASIWGFFFVDVTDEWCLVDDRGVYYNPRFRGNPVFESIELFKFLKNAQEFFSRITQRKKRATTHHFWNCKKSRSCNQIMIPVESSPPEADSTCSARE